MGSDLTAAAPGFRRYADLAIGDRFPEVPPVFEVTEALAQRFRVATLGEGAAPVESKGLAPTMLAGVYTRNAIASLKGPPGGVHAKQQFRFVRAVRIGDRLQTTLQIREKYERNGRRYVVSRLETRTPEGELVTEGQVTAVWGQETT